MESFHVESSSFIQNLKAFNISNARQLVSVYCRHVESLGSFQYFQCQATSVNVVMTNTKKEKVRNQTTYITKFRREGDGLKRRRKKRKKKKKKQLLHGATPTSSSSSSFSPFFFFLRFRFNGKQGTVRSALITVLRTVRSDRGSHESLLFSHREVLEAKRTAKMNGSRFFNQTIQSSPGFKTLIENTITTPQAYFILKNYPAILNKYSFSLIKTLFLLSIVLLVSIQNTLTQLSLSS